MKQVRQRVDLTKKVKINYDEHAETDIFDFYQEEEPYKGIKIT